MGLLNLREIGKILAGIDSRTLDQAAEAAEQGRILGDALYGYLDAYDERMRADEALYDAGEDSQKTGRFILAREKEEATLERIREIVRPMRETPPAT